MIEKIIITGANGFIGSHVAEEFIARGYSPILLVRKNSDQNHIQHLSASTVVLENWTIDDLVPIFKDADCLIHIAGKTSDWGSKESFKQILDKLLIVTLGNKTPLSFADISKIAPNSGVEVLIPTCANEAKFMKQIKIKYLLFIILKVKK